MGGPGRKEGKGRNRTGGRDEVSLPTAYAEQDGELTVCIGSGGCMGNRASVISVTVS